MNPLLAQALELGAVAHGLQDGEGHRVHVHRSAGWTRFDLLAEPVGRPMAVAFRSEGTAHRPTGVPDFVPHIPDISWVAVVDDDGLTVTWPVPGPGGSPVAGARDPVEEARRRLESEAGGEALAPTLAEGLDRVEEEHLAAGWEVTGRVELSPPVEGRVTRLARGERTRIFTLSTALGVTMLILRAPQQPMVGFRRP